MEKCQKACVFIDLSGPVYFFCVNSYSSSGSKGKNVLKTKQDFRSNIFYTGANVRIIQMQRGYKHNNLISQCSFCRVVLSENRLMNSK